MPYIPTMRINRLDSSFALIRFSISATVAFLIAVGGVGAQAQGPNAPPPGAPGAGGPQGGPGGPPGTPKVEEPPTEAERYIDLAIKKIAEIKAVSADLVQEVKMLNQDFKIQGRYLRAPGTKLRMDLTVSGLSDTQAKMLQVCDGETLWEYQQYFENKFCSKKNIKLILEKLSSPDLDAETRERATVQLGLAGPEALLMGLRKTIKFNHMEEGTLDGKAVIIAEGNWRDRTGLLGPDQQQVPAIGQLPPYIPSFAKLYLGKDDSWPYRVVLAGKPATALRAPMEKGPDGKPRARPVTDNVIPTNIQLSYNNVKFDAPANLDEFKFDPPREVPTEDITEAIVSNLDQVIKVRSAMKKSEGAGAAGAAVTSKSDVPIIDQSISVPTIPPSNDAPAPKQ